MAIFMISTLGPWIASGLVTAMPTVTSGGPDAGRPDAAATAAITSTQSWQSRSEVGIARMCFVVWHRKTSIVL